MIFDSFYQYLVQPSPLAPEISVSKVKCKLISHSWKLGGTSGHSYTAWGVWSIRVPVAGQERGAGWCPEHTGHFRLLPDGQVSRGVDDTPRARGASGNRQSPPAMWDGIL